MVLLVTSGSFRKMATYFPEGDGNRNITLVCTSWGGIGTGSISDDGVVGVVLNGDDDDVDVVVVVVNGTV